MKSNPGKKSVRIATSEPGRPTASFAGLHSKGGASALVGSNVLGDSALIGEDTISLLSKISLLEKDLERRQSSYATREEAYKARIEQLEEELNSQIADKSLSSKPGSNLGKLKAIQSEILNSVELVQDRTARIMQEQERDLLRSFRARLFDVQTELEKEKSKKDDGLVAWRERHGQLNAELSWATEVSHRLDKVNLSLSQENSLLKAKFVSQEEDRNFFVKKLVAVKKENALLRSQISEIASENEKLEGQSADQLEQLASLASSPMPVKGVNAAAQQQQQKIESEERFKETNVRLRRLLAEEQRNLQQVRQTYAQELRTRTEMELLLRKCVEDVRRAIVEQHHANAEFSNTVAVAGTDLAKLYSSQAGQLPLDEFESEERQRTLELLLSQERVVSLIYAKTFPIISASGPGGSKPHQQHLQHQPAFSNAGRNAGKGAHGVGALGAISSEGNPLLAGALLSGSNRDLAAGPGGEHNDPASSGSGTAGDSVGQTVNSTKLPALH